MIRYQYDGNGFAGCTPEGYDPQRLRSLYRSMLRIRRVEERIEQDYHEDQMKTPIHLVIGQEAVAVGTCSVLQDNDTVYTGHRTHGVYLAKGGDLRAMLAEFFCRVSGCAGSRGGSMHLLDKSVGFDGGSAIVAGAIPIATGAALAFKLRQEERVTGVFFGDAATEEGAFFEALNFAALWKLPVIFVCENNFYSVCSPLHKRQPPDVPIWRKAEAMGVTARRVDGSNVLAVREAMGGAVARARAGEGPSLLECFAYRWRAHGGSGDDSASGYRDPAEVAHWQTYCPIALYGRWLEEHNLLDDARIQGMEQAIQEEIEEGIQFAVASPEPGPGDLTTHVYG
jgi:TPP-dependent pyruvate/acetoin dehydrogenase alpha subunit